jgi:hypothetical protein
MMKAITYLTKIQCKGILIVVFVKHHKLFLKRYSIQLSMRSGGGGRGEKTPGIFQVTIISQLDRHYQI